ncbi:STAS domain-containing protein [Streptomyces sp. NPDC052013]|uniref:STAS domain-containing protein n=1 Tax=Streptomyces sp. NPDC052013 TaxID=3365679 RepID=UPI0037D7C357
MNVLLHAHRQAETNGTRLLLARVPYGTGRVLEMTGADQVLRIYATVADAEAACGT